MLISLHLEKFSLYSAYFAPYSESLQALTPVINFGIEQGDWFIAVKNQGAKLFLHKYNVCIFLRNLDFP